MTTNSPLCGLVALVVACGGASAAHASDCIAYPRAAPPIPATVPVDPARVAATSEPPKAALRCEDRKVTLASLGFKVREATDAAGVKRPATFSLLHPAGEDSVYAGRFAVLFGRPGVTDGATYTSFVASLSGNLTSSREDKADDAWQVDAGLSRFVQDRLGRHACFGPFDYLTFDATAHFEADQGLDHRSLGVQFDLSGSSERLGIDYLLPRPRPGSVVEGGAPLSWSNVYFTWIPSLTANTGARLDGSPEDSFFFRVRASASAFVLLPRVSEFLGSTPHETADDTSIPNSVAYVFAEGSVTQFLTGDLDTFDSYAVGLHLPFGATVSVDTRYENGRSLPRYEKVESFWLGLSIYL